MLFSSIISPLLLASATLASSLVERGGKGCENGPSSRKCWSNGFDLDVETDDKFPDTGKTKEYTLEITRSTASPDGFAREMMLFNGQYPGPTLEADWGDTLKITVINKLPDNGTSIHWHGLRQLHSNQMDGTNGITECPIAPGETKTYVFKCTAYGTSWYHSHYSVQYGDGLVGTIIINGPASANYDKDLGAIPLTDWFHTPNFEILASRPPAPPLSQSILVNGKGTLNGTGSYSKFTLTPGKKHLLRFINTGINNYIHIGIDGHKMEVIATDFVPIKPYTADSIVLAVGQRYEVIVDANKDVGNYWLRVGTGGGKCDGPNEKSAGMDTKGAIISYEGAGSGEPTSEPVTLKQGCIEEEGFEPYRQATVPPPTKAPTQLLLTLDTTAGVFWKVNGLAQMIDWSHPTLDYIMNGTYELPADDNGILVAHDDAAWAYYLIQNDTPLPHPIHLHGHDFWILASGHGDPGAADFKLNNPIRRDTHTVDGWVAGQPGTGGYELIAFKVDNPGVWLMHCHIPFHISGGLGVQFVESPSKIIPTLGDLTGYKEGCASWNAFQGGSGNIPQPDSGLKRKRAIRRAF